MNGKFWESFLWLLIPALGAIVEPALVKGDFFSLFSIETLNAILAAGVLAALRVYINWHNPNDPRYGNK